MSSEVDELKRALFAANGEILAVQLVLINVLKGLMKAGVLPASVIDTALSETDMLIEATAIRARKIGNPTHTQQQLEVVRYMRQELFGK